MTEESEQHPDRSSGLVVVGASAGGIEALSDFVGGLPADFPVPVVIAQHLSPLRKSSLDTILQGRTSLPVMSVDTSAKLENGTIYVVPSNRDVLITDHEVAVVDSTHSTGRPSVDLLFRSAAEVYRENLIAIVLSGTGSDGAAGAQEVRNAGGTVIIQNPETAAFPGMPRSLPPVIVDAVAEPTRMGKLIVDLLAEGKSPTRKNRMPKSARFWPNYAIRKVSISPITNNRPFAGDCNAVWWPPVIMLSVITLAMRGRNPANANSWSRVS